MRRFPQRRQNSYGGGQHYNQQRQSDPLQDHKYYRREIIKFGDNFAAVGGLERLSHLLYIPFRHEALKANEEHFAGHDSAAAVMRGMNQKPSPSMLVKAQEKLVPEDEDDDIAATHEAVKEQTSTDATTATGGSSNDRSSEGADDNVSGNAVVGELDVKVDESLIDDSSSAATTAHPLSVSRTSEADSDRKPGTPVAGATVNHDSGINARVPSGGTLRLTGVCDVIVKTLVECALHLPVKTSFYAAFAADWVNNRYRGIEDAAQYDEGAEDDTGGMHDSDKGSIKGRILDMEVLRYFGSELVKVVSFEVDTLIRSSKLWLTRNGLRFISDLVNVGIITATSLFTQYKYCLQVVNEATAIYESRNSAARGDGNRDGTTELMQDYQQMSERPDAMIMLMLSSMVQLTREVCEEYREEFEEVYNEIGKYMTNRKESRDMRLKFLEPLRSLPPSTEASAPGPTHAGEAQADWREALVFEDEDYENLFGSSGVRPDRLDMLWIAVQEMKTQGWSSRSLLHLYQSQKLSHQLTPSKSTPSFDLIPFSFLADDLLAHQSLLFVRSSLCVWPESSAQAQVATGGGMMLEEGTAKLSAADRWLLEETFLATIQCMAPAAELTAERLLKVPVFHDLFEQVLVELLFSEMIGLPVPRHPTVFYFAVLKGVSVMQHTCKPIIDKTMQYYAERVVEYDKQTLETLSEFHSWWLSCEENYSHLNDHFISESPWNTLFPLHTYPDDEKKEDESSSTTTATTTTGGVEEDHKDTLLDVANASISAASEISSTATTEATKPPSSTDSSVSARGPRPDEVDTKVTTDLTGVVARRKLRAQRAAVQSYLERVLERLVRLVWRPKLAEKVSRGLRPLLPPNAVPNCVFLNPEVMTISKQEEEELRGFQIRFQREVEEERFGPRKHIVEVNILRRLMRYSLGSEHERQDINRLAYRFMLHMVGSPQLNSEPSDLLLCLSDANTVTSDMLRQFDVMDITKVEDEDEGDNNNDTQNAGPDTDDSAAARPSAKRTRLNEHNNSSEPTNGGEFDSTAAGEDVIKEEGISYGDGLMEDDGEGDQKVSGDDVKDVKVPEGSSSMGGRDEEPYEVRGGIKVEWDYSDTDCWTDNEVVVLFTQIVLAQGTKSIAHLTRILEHYGEIFARFRPSVRSLANSDPATDGNLLYQHSSDVLVQANDLQYYVAVVGATFSFWRFSSLKCLIFLERMSEFGLMPPEAVIEHIVIMQSISELESLRSWEVLNMLVDKAASRLALAEKEIRLARRTFKDEESSTGKYDKLNVATEAISEVILSTLTAICRRLQSAVDPKDRRVLLDLFMAFGRRHALFINFDEVAKQMAVLPSCREISIVGTLLYWISQHRGLYLLKHSDDEPL